MPVFVTEDGYIGISYFARFLFCKVLWSHSLLKGGTSCRLSEKEHMESMFSSRFVHLYMNKNFAYDVKCIIAN